MTRSLRTCLATVSLGGAPEEKLDAIAAAGFDGVELLDEDVRTSALSPAAIGERCAALGLAVDLYQPFRQAEGVTDDEFADVLDRFRRELDVMAEVGASTILVVSNVDEDADPDRARSAGQLAALADVAAARGMTVTFEALAWGTRIARVADAGDVVRRADHPALTLTVDTFHLLAHRDGAEAFAGVPVGFVQLADAPWRSGPLREWSRNHRCFPGEGEFDLAGPLTALLDGGYRGPVSLEIFNPAFRADPPHEVAARGAKRLAELLGSLQARRNRAVALGSAPRSAGS